MYAPQVLRLQWLNNYVDTFLLKTVTILSQQVHFDRLFVPLHMTVVSSPFTPI